MINKVYSIWFNDGSRVIFWDQELAEYARRYDFSQYDLTHNKSADLYDERGDIIGGVLQI